MSFLETFLVAAERRVAPAVAPLVRRRRVRNLHQKGGDTAPPAPGSWWGNEPRWFGGGAPPRARNLVTPLIDGDTFFSRLHTALLAARQYVYITGWCLTPHVPLLRDTPDDLVRTRLLSVLSETAGHVPVRILLWGGAPHVIQPTRKAAGEVARTIEEQGTGDLVCRLDTTAQMSAGAGGAKTPAAGATKASTAGATSAATSASGAGAITIKKGDQIKIGISTTLTTDNAQLGRTAITRSPSSSTVNSRSSVAWI
jgi:hypothetical protein